MVSTSWSCFFTTSWFCDLNLPISISVLATSVSICFFVLKWSETKTTHSSKLFFWIAEVKSEPILEKVFWISVLMKLRYLYRDVTWTYLYLCLWTYESKKEKNAKLQIVLVNVYVEVSWTKVWSTDLLFRFVCFCFYFKLVVHLIWIFLEVWIPNKFWNFDWVPIIGCKVYDQLCISVQIKNIKQ